MIFDEVVQAQVMPNNQGTQLRFYLGECGVTHIGCLEKGKRLRLFCQYIEPIWQDFSRETSPFGYEENSLSPRQRKSALYYAEHLSQHSTISAPCDYILIPKKEHGLMKKY